jgi:hypothetical protein
MTEVPKAHRDCEHGSLEEGACPTCGIEDCAQIYRSIRHVPGLLQDEIHEVVGRVSQSV